MKRNIPPLDTSTWETHVASIEAACAEGWTVPPSALPKPADNGNLWALTVGAPALMAANHNVEQVRGFVAAAGWEHNWREINERALWDTLTHECVSFSDLADRGPLAQFDGVEPPTVNPVGILDSTVGWNLVHLGRLYEQQPSDDHIERAAAAAGCRWMSISLESLCDWFNVEPRWRSTIADDDPNASQLIDWDNHGSITLRQLLKTVAADLNVPWGLTNERHQQATADAAAQIEQRFGMAPANFVGVYEGLEGSGWEDPRT